MRKTILDIREMSDSKEVYGQRPNPAISVFIYCLIALLIAALVYSFIGEIEIVATATGVIRPNDDVSTVSSLLSGRVTGVYYSDGQIVQVGDVLFTVDTSEAQIALNSLLSSQADYQFQVDMIDQFLQGIETDKNPFSADSSSDEYPYYVQFQNYELSLQNTQDQFDYDAETTAANIETISNQITEIEKQISGLTSYKNSIEEGKNLASEYPEYESMYLLYVAELDALYDDYQAQKERVELSTAQESNQYYLDYYETQIIEYGYLVDSIENDKSAFPSGDTSECVLLYNDYVSNLSQYERDYESAKETYDYYLNGGGVENGGEDLLAYDQTMLEGYDFYRQSVEEGRDMFDADKDSVFYRSLYMSYQKEYDTLSDTVEQATEVYEALLDAPDASNEDISTALLARDQAEAKRDEYKSTTLATINNTLLQIEAAIAEKKLSIGSASADYNISTAQAKMESAEEAIVAYKNRMLLEYSQALGDLKNKAEDLQLTQLSTQDKETTLAELKTAHQSAVDQKYYQTITQIDSSIQALQTELGSAQSRLQQYQIADELYNSTDENGNPISLSLATMEQISSLLNSRESLEAQLNELDMQIRQTQEQIAQGTITAERSGTINVVSTIVKGDLISSGAVVATVIPVNESKYKAQIYVNNADIANIEPGDPIKYNLAALPSTQYGTISGVVTSVSTDSLMQDGQYSGYFMVEGSIENAELRDKDGNTGTISIGMQTEVKIVTQKKKIIWYLLDKIDLS